MLHPKIAVFYPIDNVFSCDKQLTLRNESQGASTDA